MLPQITKKLEKLPLVNSNDMIVDTPPHTSHITGKNSLNLSKNSFNEKMEREM